MCECDMLPYCICLKPRAVMSFCPIEQQLQYRYSLENPESGSRIARFDTSPYVLKEMRLTLLDMGVDPKAVLASPKS